MKRRAFIAALGGAAAWPLAARAQQAAKLPTIAFWVRPRHLTGARGPAFVGRLRELGWTEGRAVAIKNCWAEGAVNASPSSFGSRWMSSSWLVAQELQRA